MEKQWDFPYKLDCYEDPPDPRDFIFSKSKDFKYTTPSFVDWSSQMTPVKDQGRLGSCVAFAVAAMKEWEEVVSFNEQYSKIPITDVENLSESWIYWITKRLDPWPNEEGTSLRYALKTLQIYGVAAERFWVYSDTSVGRPLGFYSLQNALNNRIGSYWRLTNLAEFFSALSLKPVPIGILCFPEIFNVSSNGIVPMPSNPNNWIGGHAVCAVGFNDNTQLIKFKNSWGTSWGQNGYGYISYDYAYYYMLDAWTSLDVDKENRPFTGDMYLMKKLIYGI